MEILSLGGSRSLIVLYLNILENTFCNFLCASERRAVLTSVDLDDVGGM